MVRGELKKEFGDVIADHKNAIKKLISKLAKSK